MNGPPFIFFERIELNGGRWRAIGFLRKAKEIFREERASSPTPPMAQINKVFLLLFVHKKKPSFRLSTSM
jgi:hypothetical protein